MSKDITTYRDLDAWKESMNLCELVYELTNKFPEKELYGLTSQLRRASVSTLRTLPKGKEEKDQRSYCTTFPLQKDLYAKWKRR